VRVVNLARALELLKQAGFWTAGLAGEATQTLADANLSGKIALVLGAEGEGLRRLTREHCDILVKLPISPRMESLNVSAAAAVALYELARKA
jgi:23S rRNA (guanosine2251-2'-O)-methyltransferase